ncbi:MAG: hypothetical protein ACE5GY_06520 [Thermodesulfobacteriota bacterium]
MICAAVVGLLAVPALSHARRHRSRPIKHGRVSVRIEPRLLNIRVDGDKRITGSRQVSVVVTRKEKPRGAFKKCTRIDYLYVMMPAIMKGAGFTSLSRFGFETDDPRYKYYPNEIHYIGRLKLRPRRCNFTRRITRPLPTGTYAWPASRTMIAR